MALLCDRQIISTKSTARINNSLSDFNWHFCFYFAEFTIAFSLLKYFGGTLFLGRSTDTTSTSLSSNAPTAAANPTEFVQKVNKAQQRTGRTNMLAPVITIAVNIHGPGA